MFKSSQLASVVFLFSILMESKYSDAQVTDSIFVHWNKATISSLERQIKSTADSSQRSSYENRLSAITGYWEIENISSVNIESIRYKFLKKLIQQYGNKSLSKYFVIEANESGSKVSLRNFVLYIDSDHIATVIFYTYINDQWKQLGRFKIKNFNLHTDLKKYKATFARGLNEDDIIITKFVNKSVYQSEFFLYGTLSYSSRIKEVLDGYRQENFTK